MRAVINGIEGAVMLQYKKVYVSVALIVCTSASSVLYGAADILGGGFRMALATAMAANQVSQLADKAGQVVDKTKSGEGGGGLKAFLDDQRTQWMNSLKDVAKSATTDLNQAGQANINTFNQGLTNNTNAFNQTMQQGIVSGQTLGQNAMTAGQTTAQQFNQTAQQYNQTAQQGIASGQTLGQNAMTTGQTTAQQFHQTAQQYNQTMQQGIASGQTLGQNAINQGVATGQQFNQTAQQGIASGQTLGQNAINQGIASGQTLGQSAIDQSVATGQSLGQDAMQQGIAAGQTLGQSAINQSVAAGSTVMQNSGNSSVLGGGTSAGVQAALSGASVASAIVFNPITKDLLWISAQLLTGVVRDVFVAAGGQAYVMAKDVAKGLAGSLSSAKEELLEVMKLDKFKKLTNIQFNEYLEDKKKTLEAAAKKIGDGTVDSLLRLLPELDKDYFVLYYTEIIKLKIAAAKELFLNGFVPLFKGVLQATAEAPLRKFTEVYQGFKGTVIGWGNTVAGGAGSALQSAQDFAQAGAALFSQMGTTFGQAVTDTNAQFAAEAQRTGTNPLSIPVAQTQAASLIVPTEQQVVQVRDVENMGVQTRQQVDSQTGVTQTVLARR